MDISPYYGIEAYVCILHSTVVVDMTLEEVSILGLIMYDRDVEIESSVFGMSVEGALVQSIPMQLRWPDVVATFDSDTGSKCGSTFVCIMRVLVARGCVLTVGSLPLYMHCVHRDCLTLSQVVVLERQHSQLKISEGSFPPTFIERKVSLQKTSETEWNKIDPLIFVFISYRL